MSDSKDKKPVTFMSDDKGNLSAMRLMSILALVIAGLLAYVEAMGLGSESDQSQLILYFLVAAFAPKAVQKFAEIKK